MQKLKNVFGDRISIEGDTIKWNKEAKNTMDGKALSELVREIMRQGYDQETASRYAVLIGDTPELDPAGNVIVRDGDQVLATLDLRKLYNK